MASPTVEFHPQAADEAVDAYAWYRERSEAAGTAFTRELELAIQRACRSPDVYPDYLHGTKSCLLRRFPYLLVFRQIENRLQVIAVAHGKRRPGYWQDRIELSEGE